MINPRSTHVHERRMPKIMKPKLSTLARRHAALHAVLMEFTELSLQKENMIFIKKVAQFIQVPEKMRQLAVRGTSRASSVLVSSSLKRINPAFMSTLAHVRPKSSPDRMPG